MPQLVGLRDAGAAVLLVSAKLEEVLLISDCALMMYQGRIAGELNPREVAQEVIELLMTDEKKKVDRNLESN